MAREVRSHLAADDRSPLIHALDDDAQPTGSPAVYAVTWGLLGEVTLRFQVGAQPTRDAGLTDQALLAIVADRLSLCTLPAVSEDRALRLIRQAMALLGGDLGPPSAA